MRQPRSAVRLFPLPVAAWGFLLILFGACVSSWADEENPESEAPEEGLPAVTKHDAVIGGETVRYTATAATIPLRDSGQKVTASVFHVAYVRDGAAATEERPLVFAFNGGPGSASLWLHLGALGPRHVAFPDIGATLPKPPYALQDNAHSLLDVADLVFIDPVGTGYSRTEGEGESLQFHGVDEDIASVADFIRLYVTRHGRWESPKYLLGESYGAIRAAGLAAHLQDKHGMFLNGVMLLSGLLDYSTLLAAENNDLPYILFLPSMTAAAHFHQRLGDDLQADFAKALEESEGFARTEYASALFQGHALPGAERREVRQKLARLTGLSEAYLIDCNLRVGPFRFMKELMRSSGQTVGRLDSRVLGVDGDRRDDRPEYDPSMTLVLGPIASAMNGYLRRELQYTTDLPYASMGDVHPWNHPGKNRYTSVADRLAAAMRKNPHLRVHVACGYYDLATPYYGMIHSLDHLSVPADQRAKITVDFYEGGHMMYTNVRALEELKTDLSTFISQSN